MTRHVFQTCPLPGDVDAVRAAFVGDPSAWLPSPAREQDAGRWEIRLSAGPASRYVLATVGPPWDLGEVTWRQLAWEPHEDTALHRFLPAFDGEIGFRPEGTGTLIIQGQYAPPGGSLGQAIDSLALHRVADSTVHDLVIEVAKQLQRRLGVARADQG